MYGFDTTSLVMYFAKQLSHRYPSHFGYGLFYGRNGGSITEAIGIITETYNTEVLLEYLYPWFLHTNITCIAVGSLTQKTASGRFLRLRIFCAHSHADFLDRSLSTIISIFYWKFILFQCIFITIKPVVAKSQRQEARRYAQSFYIHFVIRCSAALYAPS